MTGNPDAPAPVADQSTGLFVLGLVGSLLLAPIGIVVGIVLLVRRRKVQGLICIGAAVAIWGTAVLLLTQPWRTAELDTTRLQLEISEWAEENEVVGTFARTDCPDSMPIERGAEYHCIVTDKEDSSVRVTVHVENDDGEVTWTVG